MYFTGRALFFFTLLRALWKKQSISFFFPPFSLSFFLVLFLASEAEGVKERSQKHYKLRNFRGDFWVRERERERGTIWFGLVNARFRGWHQSSTRGKPLVSRGRKPVQLIFANRVGRPSTRNRYHPRGGTRRIRFRNTIANVFFAFVYVFDYNEGINLSSILDSENLSRGNKSTHSLILGCWKSTIEPF